MSIHAAVIQLSSQSDVAANLARVREWVAQAAGSGAQLVALPENFAFIGDDEKKRTLAEALEGPSYGRILSTVAELASKHGVDIIAGGMPERSADFARPYNTSVLVAPTGAVVARYRKVHLFDVSLPDGTSARESEAASLGEIQQDAVTDVGGIRVGLAICYDLRFPELFRARMSAGAEAVCVSSAFTMMTGKDHFRVLVRARAIENQFYVLAPAQCGRHPLGRQTYGKSMIVDPWGDVLAQCGEGEGFAMAHIERDVVTRVRANMPCAQHRRY